MDKIYSATETNPNDHWIWEGCSLIIKFLELKSSKKNRFFDDFQSYRERMKFWCLPEESKTHWEHLKQLPDIKTQFEEAIKYVESVGHKIRSSYLEKTPTNRVIDNKLCGELTSVLQSLVRICLCNKTNEKEIDDIYNLKDYFEWRKTRLDMIMYLYCLFCNIQQSVTNTMYIHSLITNVMSPYDEKDPSNVSVSPTPSQLLSTMQSSTEIRLYTILSELRQWLIYTPSHVDITKTDNIKQDEQVKLIEQEAQSLLKHLREQIKITDLNFQWNTITNETVDQMTSMFNQLKKHLEFDIAWWKMSSSVNNNTLKTAMELLSYSCYISFIIQTKMEVEQMLTNCTLQIKRNITLETEGLREQNRLLEKLVIT